MKAQQKLFTLDHLRLLHLLLSSAKAMDSCSSWSPTTEALPTLDLILSSVAEEPTRGFCGKEEEGDNEGDGFSSCLSNETFPHLQSTTPNSSIFPVISSQVAVSPQSSNSIVAKLAWEENVSLPSPNEGVECCTMALAKRAKVDQHEATSKVQTSQSQVPKLGEKITALQQLVSPFGKTDTASVLLEAIGYIKFLQDQVHVLSSPYMKASATNKKGSGVGMDLRSRGLCLVPVSCTMKVASSNGADYWISGVSGCSR